jgi:hypothetical protein
LPRFGLDCSRSGLAKVRMIHGSHYKHSWFYSVVVLCTRMDILVLLWTDLPNALVKGTVGWNGLQNAGQERLNLTAVNLCTSLRLNSAA